MKTLLRKSFLFPILGLFTVSCASNSPVRTPQSVHSSGEVCVTSAINLVASGKPSPTGIKRFASQKSKIFSHLESEDLRMTQVEIEKLLSSSSEEVATHIRKIGAQAEDARKASLEVDRIMTENSSLYLSNTHYRYEVYSRKDTAKSWFNNIVTLSAIQMRSIQKLSQQKKPILQHNGLLNENLEAIDQTLSLFRSQEWILASSPEDHNLLLRSGQLTDSLKHGVANPLNTLLGR